MFVSYIYIWTLSTLKVFSKKSSAILLLIFFGVFISFFNYAGTDWETYNKFVVDDTQGLYFEPGFNLIIEVSRYLKSFLFLVGMIYLSFIISIRRFYIRFNSIPTWIVVLSITSIFIPLFSGALRQALAFTIIVYGYSINKKLFFCFLATFFHFSSLIFIPIYIIEKLNLKISNKLLLVIISVISLFFIVKGNTLLYTYFKSGDFYISDGTTGGLKDALIVFERLIFILCGYTLLKINFLKDYKELIYPSLLGSVIFIVFFSEFRNFAGRTLAILRMFDVIVLFFSLTYFFRRIKQRNILVPLVIVTYSLLKFVITSANI